MNIPNRGLLGRLFIFLLVGGMLWYISPPIGMDNRAWHLLIIFAITTIGIIFLPAPLGVVAILSATISVSTKTLNLSQILYGFSAGSVWLVVMVFLIAAVLVKSGLGKRIAYFFIIKFGHNTIGLSYSLIITEFLISPFIPSITARGGGIIFPIAKSFLSIYENDSHQNKDNINKMASFIIQTCFHCNVITGALFLTSMAANPIAASLAGEMGISITWMDWAKGTIIIGMINLLLLPLVISFLIGPPKNLNNNLVKNAKAELMKMGSLSFNEIVICIVFSIMILLWILGDFLNIDSTSTSFIGVSMLLILGSLTWDEALSEKSAWGTLIWLGILVSLSHALSDLGVIEWMDKEIQSIIGNNTGIMVIIAVLVVYFYMHYFFASSTVHITVLYSSFLIILLKIGMPSLVAALLLAVLANLSGGLTHYGSATAPIYFGSGVMSVKKWWKMGIVISIFNLLIWGILAPMWWKFLGWW